jgi:hypothetical protein
MQRKLRPHQIGKQNAFATRLAADQGCRGLIAARLDAENHEVTLLWDSSHDASLQGKTGAIEGYDAFLSI